MLRPFAGNASLYAVIQVEPGLFDYLGSRMMTSRHGWGEACLVDSTGGEFGRLSWEWRAQSEGPLSAEGNRPERGFRECRLSGPIQGA